MSEQLLNKCNLATYKAMEDPTNLLYKFRAYQYQERFYKELKWKK